MTAAPAPQPATARAIPSLAVHQQLVLEAGLSASRAQLIFRILNRTVAFCHYDRASLWLLRGGKPRLAGISGDAKVDPHTPLAEDWRTLIAANTRRDEPAILDETAITRALPTWHALQERTPGVSFAWIPIPVAGKNIAGLWLERWEQPWTDAEVQSLGSLALGYGIAWRAVTAKPSLIQRLPTRRRAWASAIAATALVLALLFVRVPLRVVAPCEVVPADPTAITAPLEGVIDRVAVAPGRAVKQGQALAYYDDRVARQQLAVARQQVEVVASELQRIRVRAFNDPSLRPEITKLEKRLAQEKTRLELAEYRAAQLEIRAPRDGVVMFDDPNTWRGQTVRIGQRIMMLVDENHTRAQIWLPENDYIPFDRGRAARIVLHADPAASHRATLTYIGSTSQIDTLGFASFRAEANWADDADPPALGLKGSAVLYGDDVPLGYWLLRKPLAWTRRQLGL